MLPQHRSQTRMQGQHGIELSQAAYAPEGAGECRHDSLQPMSDTDGNKIEVVQGQLFA